jgi:O-acetyl-ADP-ribose deacetylase (regulator of RNase III)
MWPNNLDRVKIVLLMIARAISKLRRWRMKTLKLFGPPANASELRLSIGDQNSDVARALAEAFSDVKDVEVVEGNLLDTGCEAIVSPANSFGDMGGGIDKAIDNFHQGAAQRALMQLIAERYFGELPVGVALIVELSSQRLPFVVAAPTMRVPGRLPAKSVNAYLSMRAALVAVLRRNEVSSRLIRRLAVPGLCTGIGGMPAAESASQMRAAYDSIIGGQWRQVVHSAMAPYAMRD